MLNKVAKVADRNGAVSGAEDKLKLFFYMEAKSERI